MLTAEKNETITRVGPGTPMGTLMRCYWHPVGISSAVNAGGQPLKVTVLGEDLTLFRNHAGVPALVARRCAHRLTSLAYGRVEDGGIRCPFHGWLYGPDGRCMQTPAEAQGSKLKDTIRITAYPCEEAGGLIFAYLGLPERQPSFPLYEVLAPLQGTRAIDLYVAGGNFLQHLEGALDTVHLSYLHATNWSTTKAKLFAMPKPALSHRETDYGIWQTSYVPNVTIHRDYGDADGIMQTLYTHFVFPASFLRVQEHMPNSGLVQKTMSWYVPVDDMTTARYQVGFSPPWPDGTFYQWPTEKTADPTPHNDYFRDYDQTDTISGIPVTAHRSPIQQNISYIPQDTMANEQQGGICDRTQEHLSPYDAVLVNMRRMYFSAMDAVAAGRDPKNVYRGLAPGQIVPIHTEEQGNNYGELGRT